MGLMTRICYVCSYPPAQRELGGGGWTDRRLLAALRDGGHDVEVVTVTGPQGSSLAEGFLSRSAGEVPLQVRSDKRLLRRVIGRMLASGEPYLSAKFTAFPGWQDAVNLLRDSTGTRLVVTNGWPALLLASAADVEVQMHVAQNVESLVARAHSPLPLRLLREESKLSRLEQDLLSRPRVLTAISHADVETFKSWGLGAEFIPLPLRGRNRDVVPSTIGFIGKASWPPNAASLQLLLGPVREELDRRGGCPPIHLAGQGTEAFAHVSGVVSSGWVDDESAFLDGIGLMVVPRFGVTTGVSIKLLEASEHDVQCVTSTDVGRACAAKPPWLLADDAESVAAAVTRYFSAIDNDALRQFVAGRSAARTLAVIADALGRAA